MQTKYIHINQHFRYDLQNRCLYIHEWVGMIVKKKVGRFLISTILQIATVCERTILFQQKTHTYTHISFRKEPWPKIFLTQNMLLSTFPKFSYKYFSTKYFVAYIRPLDYISHVITLNCIIIFVTNSSSMFLASAIT